MQTVSFRVSRDYVRRFSFKDESGRPYTVHHVYPTLADFFGGNIPEKVNPRSHGAKCLKGKVPKAIRDTVYERPADFVLANRGSTILNSQLFYDEKSEVMNLRFADYDSDEPIHGIADGATTNAVVTDIQSDVFQQVVTEHQLPENYKSFKDLSGTDFVPDYLKNARIHLEIITGITSRSKISALSEGRNTSTPVKSWTMKDFNGAFDWLKVILDGEEYANKVGYEENANKDVEVLDIIAVLNLFHEVYTETGKAPTQSYSAKGQMAEFVSDPARLPGFRKLEPVVTDVLDLHDLVISTLPQVYNAGLGRKLGALGEKDNKVCQKLRKPEKLTFSDRKATHKIPKGILFPILGSMRALIRYKGGKAGWRMSPDVFWNSHAKTLVEIAFDYFREDNYNPQSMGKNALVYNALFKEVRLALLED